MTVGYIDTSFLLSLLFGDANYAKSIAGWNRLDLLFSSLLLDIESRINVYKYCVVARKDQRMYRQMEHRLDELLANINRKAVDREIVAEISNVAVLKRPKSLDATHLATAHIIGKLVDGQVFLCSYDKHMIKIAAQLGIQSLE